ncbi:MAG: hypothetical protein AB1432_11675 [Bacteroidota bacterium]
MKKNYSVPIQLVGDAAEKVNQLASTLDTSIQKIANKLIVSVVDQALENVNNFLAEFDAENKKQFLKIFDGTLEQWNYQTKNRRKKK